MHEAPLIFTEHSIQRIQAGRKTQTRRLLNLDKLRVYAPCLVTGDWPFDRTRARRGYYYAGMNRNGAVWAKLGRRDKDVDALGLKPGEFDFVLPWIVGKTHLGDYGHGRKRWTITPGEPCRIWVKETWREVYNGAVSYRADPPRGWLGCAIDDPDCEGDDDCLHEVKWQSSMFMPRRYARIMLDVVSVRVERLQDIDALDAVEEGCEGATAKGRLNGVEGEYVVGDPREEFSRLWDSINGKRADWRSNPWIARIEFTPAEMK